VSTRCRFNLRWRAFNEQARLAIGAGLRIHSSDGLFIACPGSAFDDVVYPTVLRFSYHERSYNFLLYHVIALTSS